MKALSLLFLLIVSILTLKLHVEQKKPAGPRIRKSIHALNKAQRKAFFWSLKALGVLPPPQGFMEWTHNSALAVHQTLEDYKICDVKPKCLQDLLIATHKTNNMHKTFLFMPWHKHWQMIYEIWLTFAHNVLKEGKYKLLSVYPEEFYTKNAALWDKVFDQYKKDGCADLQYTAAHYWNPTNYKDNRDILVAMEVSSPYNYPNKELDTMDNLFYAVRGHYCWQYSVKTRLVSQQYKWNLTDVRQKLVRAGHFPHTNKSSKYSQNVKNMLKGILNPRLQPEGQTFDDFNQTLSYFQPDQLPGQINSKITTRYKDYFQKGNQDSIAVYRSKDSELLNDYGADSEIQINGQKKLIKRSFITKKERLQLNMPYNSMLFYNNRLPHYTYARTLYNKFYVPTFKDYMFFHHGMEKPHSQMHAYTAQAYDVIGFNIYVYHGAIDLMIEMKIRAANNEDRLSKRGKYNFQALRREYEVRKVYDEMFLVQDEYLKLNQSQQAQYDVYMNRDINQYYDKYFQNNEQIFPKKREDIIKDTFREMDVGDWLIDQWKHPYLFLQIKENKTVEPNVHSITPGFTYRDYMLNSERIRESTEMNELYQKSYVKHHGHKYEKFINLSTHNFNYQYEIYDEGKTYLLNKDASNIFKYLKDMKAETEEDLYDVLRVNINTTIDHFYNSTTPVFTLPREEINYLYKSDPIGNYMEVKSHLIDYYNTVLKNVSFTYVTYPANKPLGFYDIKVKLDPKTQCAGNFSEKLSGLGISQSFISQLQTSGILLHRLNVRESSNKSYCANCSGDKHIILDLDIDLFQTNRTVWQAIRKIYIGDSPILASSQTETSIGECFTNFAKLFAVEQLKEGQRPISPRIVAGAEEIKMKVIVENEDNYLLQGSLEVQITSISVNYAQNNLRTSSIKQLQNIHSFKFDFYRLKDLEKFTVANKIKSYLYHTIKVTWHLNNGGSKEIIQYTIPHFTILANLKIILNNTDYTIRLEDADYDFKKQLVYNFDEELLRKQYFSE